MIEPTHRPTAQQVPEHTDHVLDSNGVEVKVGTRVRMWDEHPEGSLGTVLEITDWDGDVDDDTGRSIIIPPDVVVRWDGEDGTDTFRTSEWTGEEGGHIIDSEGFYAGPAWVTITGKVEDLMAVPTERTA